MGPERMKEPQQVSGEGSTQRLREPESGSGREGASLLDHVGLGPGAGAGGS